MEREKEKELRVERDMPGLLLCMRVALHRAFARRQTQCAVRSAQSFVHMMGVLSPLSYTLVPHPTLFSFSRSFSST